MAQGKKWKSEYYNPKFLMSGEIEESQIRKEYERLSAIANEKLAKFVDTEWERTEVYKQNVGKFIPSSDIKSTRELAYLLSDVKRYLDAELNSVWALQRHRAETIRTLHERGYTFVNKANFHAFTKFMDEYRERNLHRIYDSERVAEVFDIASKKNIDPQILLENFEYWEENQDKLEALPRRRGKEISTSGDLFKELDSYGIYHRGNPTTVNRKNKTAKKE